MSNNSDYAATMYESDPMVAALNRVPGFDPLKLMSRRRTPGAEKDERYLDFRYKKLWFRLAHRTGRIRLNKLSVTEQFAIIEAQVYLELTDANPVSSFTATCTKEEGGDKYIESAQIKAMDQALTDAGFGLQFVPAPIGGAEHTAPQAAASPATNVQMPVTAPKAVQAAANTAEKGQVPVAAPKAVQPTVQQRQQAAVQQHTVSQQAAVQQKTATVQPTAQQRTMAPQAAAQQRTMAPQAAVQQRAAAPQAVVQQQSAAPQQRPMTQQQAVQRQPVAQQAVQQRPVPVQQRPTAQQPVAQQPTVQQGPTTVQQRPAPQQRPAAAQQQIIARQAAASAQTAQVQTAQAVQNGTRPAQTPAGMQKAAINPAASASPQKSSAAVPAPQMAAQPPANAETLPADQLPVTVEEQALPITSDVVAAMSMLSGKGEPDTLPVASEGAKAEEKAEAMPEELSVAPTATNAAASVVLDTAPSVAPASTAPAAPSTAAPAPAASAGQTAKEDKPYTEATPIEEILQSMTLEDAKKVVVPTGTCRGWTLDEVAQRRRPSLRFYLSEGYQGKDNILRAAARLVLDDLEKKAG